MSGIFSKKYLKVSAVLSALLSSVLVSHSAFAGWTLNSDNSSLFYVTSKAGAVSEVNSFSSLSGSIADNGQASVEINLGSVDTAIDIRNERMREIVFQVATYPMATVSLSTDPRLINSLLPGENILRSHEIAVDLHGNEQTLSIEVSMTRLLGGGLQVALAKPLLVNAAVFGLDSAVEELREIAGLPGINHNIVVDFTLQFDPD